MADSGAMLTIIAFCGEPQGQALGTYPNIYVVLRNRQLVSEVSI